MYSLSEFSSTFLFFLFCLVLAWVFLRLCSGVGFEFGRGGCVYVLNRRHFSIYLKVFISPKTLTNPNPQTQSIPMNSRIKKRLSLSSLRLSVSPSSSSSCTRTVYFFLLKKKERNFTLWTDQLALVILLTIRFRFMIKKKLNSLLFS